MKKLILIPVSFWGLVAYAHPSMNPVPVDPDEGEATSVVYGTFLRIETGDYQHLVLRVRNRENDFWCMHRKAITCDDLENRASEYVGKRLRVRYRTKRVYVPEAGGEILQKQTISIRLAE